MRQYAKSASKDVKGAMHKKKRGTLKSGSGKKVKSPKQAIAIGLSEARRKGNTCPPDNNCRWSAATDRSTSSAWGNSALPSSVSR